MSTENDPHGFAQAETRLLELAKALDGPVAREPYKLALVALGQRSRTLFRAFRQVHRGGASDAAGALVRPMVEINLLIRFLVKSPALHTELWEAEGKRNSLTIVDEFARSKEMKERWAAFPLNTEGAQERRAEVEQVRDNARKAGVKGVGENGAVLPSISTLLAIIDELGAYEGYTLAYRVLSWEVHGGAPAVLTERFREHEDGALSYIQQRGPGTDGERALAISIFASTLKLCGYHLDLGIDEAAREIQSTYVPQSPDRPQAPVS